MYKYLLYITAVCFMTGCNNESDSINKQEYEKSNLLSIHAGPAIHANLTRNTIDTDTFPENTAIAVFVTGKKYVREIAYYTLNKKVWQQPVASRIYINKDTATVYGFYPANATLLPLEKDSLHKIQIRIAKTDTLFTHYKQTDYMYATGAYNETDQKYPLSKVAYRENEVNVANLFFHHALSQIALVINKTEDYKGTGKITRFELRSTKENAFRVGKGTLTLNEGTIALPDTCTRLIFAGDTVVANAYAATPSKQVLISRLMPPMNSLNGISLHFTIDGTQMHVSLPVNPVTIWEQGKKYTYTLYLNNSDLTFDSLILSDWINQVVSPISIIM